MASPIGDLVVRIGADLSGLANGVKSAQSHLAKLGAQMRTGINVATRYAAAMTAAGVAVVAALVVNAMNAIDAQAKLARQLRATNVGLASLTRAADLAGVEQAALEKGVKKLDVAIGESIRGTASYQDAFAKLGLSAQKLSEMDADERIKAINQALIENVPAAEQSMVAGILFGTRVGKAIGSISVDELARAREEVVALGLAVSEVDSETIERANDAISTIKEVATGAANRVAVALAPAIDVLSDRLMKAAMDSEGFKKQIESAFQGAMFAAGKFADVIQGLRVVFKGVELVVKGFGAVVMSVVEIAFTAVYRFIDAVRREVNETIKIMNKLPKVDIELIEPDPGMVNFMDTLHELSDKARASVGATRDELVALAMQEMPSEKIKRFMEEVEAASRAASVASIAEREAVVLGGAETAVSVNPAAEKKAAAEEAARRESLQGRIDSLREALMSESELENKHYKESLADLTDWQQSGLDINNEFHAMREELTASHHEKLKEIAAKAEEERVAGLADKVNALRESLMTESELEIARHEENLEALIAWQQAGLDIHNEFYALKEEAEAAHQERLTAIEDEGLAARMAFEKMSLRQRAKNVSAELANITAGVSQHNRAMFNLNKAAGIANAIINAYEGISLTMKSYPYPLNIGMAAAHAAAAFAQVSAIKSASFGQGGAAPSIAGSTPAAPVTPVNSGAPSQLGGRGGGGRIAVEGVSLSTLMDGRSVRELFEALQEHMRDGGEVVFVN